MPVLSGRINSIPFSTTSNFCFPKIPMKYSKNGQNFATSESTSNVLFGTCWTPWWSRSRYTFFWMTRYLYKWVCLSVRPSVGPSVTHELNFWNMRFPGWIWTKKHQEDKTIPLERPFRYKYACRSPECIWCLNSLRLIFKNIYKHNYNHHKNSTTATTATTATAATTATTATATIATTTITSAWI